VSEEHQCSGEVYVKGSGKYGGIVKYRQCTRSGRYEYEGKYYCGVHHPGMDHARQAKRAKERQDAREGEARVRNLNAAASDMLAALEAVEWVYNNSKGRVFCLKCLHMKSEGHASSCPIGNALKKARGES